MKQRTWPLLLAVLALAGCSSTQFATYAMSKGGQPLRAAGTTDGPRYFSSIVWAVMENHSVGQVQDLSAEKFLIANGASFAHYYGVTHPSGPNYRVMTSGKIWTHNETYSQQVPTVATELQAIGLPTFDWYMQGEPAIRHNPYLDLKSPITIKQNSDAFVPDTLPPACQVYLGYDDDNDAHDGPLSVADTNMSALIKTLDQSHWFNTADAHGKYPVLMLTWDESYTLNNNILTAFYGRGVKAGYVSNKKYDHYNFCRTLTDNWGLQPLEDAAKADPIDDIWK